MTEALFDHHAGNYDKEFSQNPLGSHYRKLVHKYLAMHFSLKDMLVFEVNCGTGEDALFFASSQACLLATDQSPEMVSLARSKVRRFSVKNSPEFKVMDLKKLSATSNHYDLVFSNFGGLNCLSPDELKDALDNLILTLKPGGSLVLVMMPRFCLFESLYFLFRLRFSSVFRRFNRHSSVMLEGKLIPTWYYSPGQVIKLARQSVVRTLPVGFFLPPPGLFPLFLKFPLLAKLFTFLDRKMGSWSLLAGMSDHFLLHLKKA